MIVENLVGTAANFIPRNVGVKDTVVNLNRLTNFTTANNRIAIFVGQMPDVSTLYEYNTLDQLVADLAESHVATIEGLGFTYLYDFNSKERLIKVTLPDALEFIPLVNGSITWFTVMLTEDTGEKTEGEEVLIFSDSIGVWEDESRSVVVDHLDVAVDQVNIFKSFLLSIKDSITSELV